MRCSEVQLDEVQMGKSKVSTRVVKWSEGLSNKLSIIIIRYIDQLPRRCFHLIVVRRFEYASDPESYTSGSVATGRASLAGQVKG